MHTRYIRLILFAGILLALCACGSSQSGDDGSGLATQDFGTDMNGIAFIGSARWIECHEGPAFGDTVVPDYLASSHVVHSTAISADSADDCLECHDPVGDGVTLEGSLDPAEVPEGGLAAIGCEGCHGAGGEHFGAEPLPNPTPDYAVCGSCHTALPVGPEGHDGSGGDGILEDYLAGPHASTLQGTSIALCSRCHSDEGFRAFASETAGFSAGQLELALSDSVPPEILSTVQCRTCHESHSGELRATETFDPETGAAYSRQFNLCTTCHHVFLESELDAVTQEITYELDTVREPLHGTAGDPLADGDMGIWDTHFPSQEFGIEGYNIDPSAADACSGCHDPHSTN